MLMDMIKLIYSNTLKGWKKHLICELLKTCKYKSRVINKCLLRLNLTFVISNESNFGGVPDPISNILGCKTTFPLPEMVTFFRSEALLKVFAKSSTWWHPSNRTDPAFSGSESAL